TKRSTFSNVSNEIRLSIKQMLKHLKKLTKGGPKMVAGSLCYVDAGELHELRTTDDVFAWIDQYATVDWRRNGLSRDVFVAGLKQQVEKWAWAEPRPHFPPLPDVLYLVEPPEAKKTGKLDELISRFNPATP